MNYKTWLIIILGTFATALIGSLFSMGGMGWYSGLILPPGTFPNSVIGGVWIILFILAATSASLVLEEKTGTKQEQIIKWLFIVNALLNILWTFLFFSLHLILVSGVEAGLLAMSVLGLIIYIWPKNIISALLLIPYLLWSTFAIYLIYMVWVLNHLV